MIDQESMKLLIRLLALLGFLELAVAQFCDPDQPRTACAGSNELKCMDYGCCWAPKTDEPSCFFQTPKYIVKSVTNTASGKTLDLEFDGELKYQSLPGSPISPLTVEVTPLSTHTLHVKIYGPYHARWEIPQWMVPIPPLPAKPINYADYDYKLPEVGEEFYFSVFRQYYNTSIFNTTSLPLFFGSQFLQIGTNLVPDYSIYGLGEHKTSLRLKPGQTYTLWNYDTPTPKDVNLYGSHPFYLEVTDDDYGSAHGVFLRNSNGMDVELGDTSLTYKVIGGVLDFYFMTGYSPDDVIGNYLQIVGRPTMPPYWALGFHQCRWGYKDLQDVKDVVSNFASNKIPLDTMWTDIDYMDKYKDFTTDPANFPVAGMKAFIDELHRNGQHYVVIVDPAISNTQGYAPYDDGTTLGVFVKNADGQIFIGKVWPGDTVFPDFTYPIARNYWISQISDFLKQVPADGLWIDMNEPSNFCNGQCHNASDPSSRPDPSVDYNNPPYRINNHGARLPLNTKTLDMDAVLFDSLAYNTHNLYGLTESMATYNALMSAKKGKRPFVLSRSTFAGSGKYAAHWLGDNAATAEDMYYSIPGILNFQMFGVPLVGADICGFDGFTSEELCARWMELGAFYPFSRNHNSKLSTSQEPYRWPSVAAISRKYLSLRYSILPYYYTLFFRATADPSNYMYDATSGMVLTPLFIKFPADKECRSIDTQFLIGEGLLISPQLKLGFEGKTLDVYFPGGQWYDWYTWDEVLATPGYQTIETPLDYIPIHVYGGNIIPLQLPGMTTAESRNNPYSLLVALQGGNANGYLYLDDGETYNTTEFTFVSYSCFSGELTSYVSGTNYATKMNLPMLRNVTVIGLESIPSVVALEGRPIPFTFIEGRTFKLMMNNLNINMDTEFHLTWI